MKPTDKVKERCISTMRNLISQGNSPEKTVLAVSALTGVSPDELKNWLNSENFQNFLESPQSDNSPENALKLPKKRDKLAAYRDRRWNKAGQRHPEDIQLEEVQEEYLLQHYDF